MKVEARYCDACGVKIDPDDLKEGAVQEDDSVFYCKPCHEKRGPKPKAEEEARPADAKEGAKARPRPSSKRITSSRRIIARRLASGRLARTKAKMPPALSASGEDLRKDPLDKSDRLEKAAPDKKKIEDRAKIRNKLDQEKKKPKPEAKKPDAAEEKKPDAEPKKADAEAKKSDVAAKKADSKSDAAKAAKADDKPKKKKKKKGKKAKKAAAAAAAAAAKAAETPAKAEDKSEAKASESAEAKSAQAKSADAEAKSADEKKPDEKKSEAKASESAEAKSAEAKSADAKSEEKPAEVASAEKASTESAEKASEEKAEPAEKPKKKKAKASEDELDELEEITSEDEPARAKKKDKEKDKDASSERKALAEKSPEKKKKSSDDAKATSGTAAALKKSGSDGKVASAEHGKSGAKIKTAMRTRPGLGKRIGSKVAVEAAQADPGELPKKPKLPLVPMIALGGIVLLLLIAIPFMNSGDKPEQKKQDPAAFLADLRETASRVKDAEEIAARWDGLSEAVEGEAKAECVTEGAAVKSRVETEAKAKLSEVRGSVDRALSGHDFDAALKALVDFPPHLRATVAWRGEGPGLEVKIGRRRAAHQAGTALLKEAQRLWESEKNKDAIEGLYAAFSDEHRQTEEGKTIAEQFAQLIAQATSSEIASSGEKAKAEREKTQLANYQKICEKRARIVAESEGDMRKELGDDLFEWQVRPDMMSGMSLKDAVKAVGGKLSVKNDGRENFYIGKNKRDWSHFIVEFKVKVAKGTKAWFLGKVQQNQKRGFSWDNSPGAPGIPITASAVPDALKGRAHHFQGIAEETWVTLQYRFIGKAWDVVVDGKEVFLLQVDPENQVGGFGFMCSQGSMEIDSVRTKVLSRRNLQGDDEEE